MREQKESDINNEYRGIVEYAKKEIKGVRAVYIWLASILGIIIVVGTVFNYKSAGDFRNEMRKDIKGYKEDIQNLKSEVERRVDRELGKEAIQSLIEKKVTDHVDKSAESIIASQIEDKINPKITKAEKKISDLDKEIARIKRRNDLAELADSAIITGKVDIYNELKSLVNDPNEEVSVRTIAKAELRKVESFFSLSYADEIYPPERLEYTDKSGNLTKYHKIPASGLVELFKNTTNFGEKTTILQQLSYKNNKNEQEFVADFLMKVAKTTGHLRIKHEAIGSLQAVLNDFTCNPFDCKSMEELLKKWKIKNKK